VKITIDGLGMDFINSIPENVRHTDTATPAADNDSKYQPTEEVVMNARALDTEDGLLKLFTDSVKNLYRAENHLVKTLPKMIKSASTKSFTGCHN